MTLIDELEAAYPWGWTLVVPNEHLGPIAITTRDGLTYSVGRSVRKPDQYHGAVATEGARPWERAIEQGWFGSPVEAVEGLRAAADGGPHPAEERDRVERGQKAAPDLDWRIVDGRGAAVISDRLRLRFVAHEPWEYPWLALVVVVDGKEVVLIEVDGDPLGWAVEEIRRRARLLAGLSAELGAWAGREP